MSWNFSVTAKPVGELESALEEASKTSREYSQENSEQVSVAILAAILIAKSEAVGESTKKFNVTLTGHSNPGHQPASGMSNDGIYVSVYQAV